jgi:hypothetical protein
MEVYYMAFVPWTEYHDDQRVEDTPFYSTAPFQCALLTARSGKSSLAGNHKKESLRKSVRKFLQHLDKLHDIGPYNLHSTPLLGIERL